MSSESGTWDGDGGRGEGDWGWGWVMTHTHGPWATMGMGDGDTRWGWGWGCRMGDCQIGDDGSGLGMQVEDGMPVEDSRCTEKCKSCGSGRD